MDITPLELLSLVMVTQDWIELGGMETESNPNSISWDDWLEPPANLAADEKRELIPVG